MTETFFLFGVYLGLLGLGVSFTLLSSGLRVEIQRDEDIKRGEFPHKFP